jgi:hypothetical protein
VRRRGRKRQYHDEASITGRFGQTPRPRSNRAPRGTIRLVNHWNAGVIVDVDGGRYAVASGRQETIERQAGSFTYRVVGVRTPVMRDLPAGAAGVMTRASTPGIDHAR